MIYIILNRVVHFQQADQKVKVVLFDIAVDQYVIFTWDGFY